MKYLVQQALSLFLALPVNEITLFGLQYGYYLDSISISFVFFILLVSDSYGNITSFGIFWIKNSLWWALLH